jgi:hypothetical protein
MRGTAGQAACTCTHTEYTIAEVRERVGVKYCLEHTMSLMALLLSGTTAVLKHPQSNLLLRRKQHHPVPTQKM